MNRRILVIDDNTDFTDSVCDILATKNYVTEVAANGKEALQLIWVRRFDLILLDINMPQMNGKSFIEELKNHKYAIPVIVISGIDINEIKNYFFEQGAISFLKKPFNHTTLLSLVENTLKLSQSISITTDSPEGAFSVKKLIPDYSELSEMDREFIDLLLKQINEHMLSSQFSVEFISGRMNYSRRQFNRKIKKYFERTPHHVLSEIRFHMIHNLMKTNQLTFSEIGETLGFSSTHYFKKVFRKYVTLN